MNNQTKLCASVVDSALVGNVSVDLLKQVPTSLRRRLSSYSKLIFSAIFELAERNCRVLQVPVVLASRHGDLHRTEKLLRELVRGESLSPTQFGLSVNNAVLGQYSMAVSNQTAMTTISAGEQTYQLGWVEAIAQIQYESTAVLLVIADESVPEVYKNQTNSPQSAFAHAVLLDRYNGRKVIMDQSTTQPCDIDTSELASKVQTALQNGNQTLAFSQGDKGWSWRVS